MISTFRTWFRPAAKPIETPKKPWDNILETDEFKESQMADNYIPQDFEIVDWSQEEMFDHILKRLEELEFKIDKLL
jgi:hypothetical protein